jgi:hypothetical protein
MFWSRRFRRLMPGALSAFVFIGLIGSAIGDASQLARLRWDGLAALFYVSNWRFIYLGNDYADLFASPSCTHIEPSVSSRPPSFGISWGLTWALLTPGEVTIPP